MFIKSLFAVIHTRVHNSPVALVGACQHICFFRNISQDLFLPQSSKMKNHHFVQMESNLGIAWMFRKSTNRICTQKFTYHQMHPIQPISSQNHSLEYHSIIIGSWFLFKGLLWSFRHRQNCCKVPSRSEKSTLENWRNALSSFENRRNTVYKSILSWAGVGLCLYHYQGQTERMPSCL